MTLTHLRIWFADLWPVLWFCALVFIVLTGLTLLMVRCDPNYEPAAQSEFTW